MQLDSFDVFIRREALAELKAIADASDVEFLETTGYTNMHFHTFYSYNAEGFSPSKIAWLAKKTGLAIAGIVDFDVLAGLDEFYEAAAMLDLKANRIPGTAWLIEDWQEKEFRMNGQYSKMAAYCFSTWRAKKPKNVVSGEHQRKRKPIMPISGQP